MRYVDVVCIKCKKEYKRRKSSIKNWSGYCKNCYGVLRRNHPIEIDKEWKRMLDKRYRKKYPYRKKESNRKWYSKYGKRCREDNRSRIRNNAKQSRLRLRFLLLERDNFTCQYCGRKSPFVELQIDHIKPKSKGGLNKKENYITSCRDCNLGKGDILLNNGSLST